MDTNFTPFMDDGTQDASAEKVLQISVAGAEHGRIVSGWAVFDPDLAYFRGYQNEWTRDLGQARLYRTRAMAEMAAARHVMEDE